MALIAVSIFVSDASEVEAALKRAVRAAERGAQLVEWRVDELAGSDGVGRAAAAQLIAQSPLPSIITCRGEAEGGMYDDSDEADRLELLEHVLTQSQRPRFVDLEFSAFTRLDQEDREKLLSSMRVGESETRLILSSHDFDGRPVDLLRRVHMMAAEPACDIVKIAWRARSLRDNLEAFDLLAERSKPMIALGMGEFGLMSRVLLGKFGGFLTYASDTDDAETAPGQPTIDELVQRYRFASINRHTRVFGVIGWPVDRSLSPVVHNAGFEAIGFDGVYLPLPVPPEWEHFKATLGSLLDHTALGFRGASVTMPHKLNLVRFVREHGGKVDSLSDRCGAANTLIVHDNGTLECINTDAAGIVQALAEGMHIAPYELAGRNIAILGTGGTARTAAIALSDLGATVVIFSREQARADECVRQLREHQKTGKIVAGRRDRLDCDCYDVIINCTLQSEESPLPETVKLTPEVTVFDVHYVPRETPLLKAARDAGARTIDGMALFVRQAAMQFERWTGEKPPPQFTAQIG